MNNYCEAHVCTQRNRLKKYNNSTYLQNGQDFEIELYNPTQSAKLAKIWLNGKLISSAGLVLKPAQRVYLERFIDTPKKFVFETYTVDNTPETQEAIAKNGEVRIEFYDEKTPINYAPYTPYYDDYWVRYTKRRNLNDWYYSGNSTSIGFMPMGSTLTNTSNNSLSTFSCSTAPTMQASTKETGRVEQGSHSNQNFTNYYGDFNSWCSHTVYLKILPFSEKPLEQQDFAQYCTSCGTKNKAGKFNFCPKCGTRY